MQLDSRRYILLTGATASGKSALALEWAEKYDAVIINCDSMQIYKGLNLLTSMPSPQDTARIQHFLYDYVEPAVAYSVGHWLADVKNLINNLPSRRKIIFVGGTGLYFKALLGELSVIPPVIEAIREKWRDKLKTEGSEELHKLLCMHDMPSAQRIMPSDGQRIVRALEVWENSGKPLSYWQVFKTPAIIPEEESNKLVLTIDREKLYRNIEKRCDALLAKGLLREIQAFIDLQLPEDLPAMRAIGVAEFTAYLNGAIPMAQAVSLLKTHTRQYAKRQLTWQRHQLDDNWQRLAL